MDTATILPTRTVKHIIVGTKSYDLPEGTTDVNATSYIDTVARLSTCTWGYAGPATDATLVVVGVRCKRGERLSVAFKRANARLQKIIAPV